MKVTSNSYNLLTMICSAKKDTLSSNDTDIDSQFHNVTRTP